MTFATDILEWKSHHIKKRSQQSKVKKKGDKLCYLALLHETLLKNPWNTLKHLWNTLKVNSNTLEMFTLRTISQTPLRYSKQPWNIPRVPLKYSWGTLNLKHPWNRTSCGIGTWSSNADLLFQNLEFILTIVIRENHITFVDPKII